MSIYRYMKLAPLIIMLVLLTAASGLFTPTVSAHASLIQANPPENSHLKESPSLISFTFNERLDEGLFYIKLFNQKGSEVTKQKAVMNADHTGIELQISKLPEGIYVISYHVISADGHPVGGSYPITIGQPPLSDASPDLSAPSVHNHGDLSSANATIVVQYFSRGFWYFCFLALAGWILWLRLPSSGGAAGRQALASWTKNLQRVHFIALLIFIFTHMEDLLGHQGAVGGSQIAQLFTSTGVGLSWTGLLVLSLAGFGLLQRWLWADVLWVLALLAVKSGTGHAVAFPPQSVTVALNFIHLAAAALWVGGLVLVAVQLLQKKEEGIGRFLQTFSKMALISIVVLTLTGSATILLFLPNPQYLLYSLWGKLLIVKIGLVVLVIITGIFLRNAMRHKREQQFQRLLKLDFSLMLIIIVIVGFITYLAPIPANEPLKWHVMGETVHMSAEITPNVQGVNTFTVKVWMPEKIGKPKQVQMILHYENDKKIAPIEVQLALYSDQTNEESYGFAKTSFKAEGAYLPFKGAWSLEVRVMDSEDNEKVYNKDFMVY
jgi:copper transport protein